MPNLSRIRIIGPPEICAVCCIAVLLFSCTVSDAEPDVPTTQPMPNFIRFVSDGHGGGKMQAAIAHYENAEGIRIDLLSTIHIGDSTFFHDISKRFSKYDAVLYELVAPKGVPPVEEGVNDQQRQIADDCDLENQGPHISYERSNFVHADLSLEEIKQLEVEKHGTFKGALGDGPGLKAARDEHDTADQRDVFADLQAARSAKPGERIRLLRRAYSKILEVTSRPMPGQTYPAGMEILVGKRNDEVMRVMRQQLGDQKKHIAVFYGAAHMVDLEHRLIQLGFVRQKVEWQTAWTVASDRASTTRQAGK